MRPSDDRVEVYVCTTPVDFRKQINGLAQWVESAMSLDPLSSAVFAFTNRRRDRVSVVRLDDRWWIPFPLLNGCHE